MYLSLNLSLNRVGLQKTPFIKTENVEYILAFYNTSFNPCFFIVNANIHLGLYFDSLDFYDCIREFNSFHNQINIKYILNDLQATVSMSFGDICISTIGNNSNIT